MPAIRQMVLAAGSAAGWRSTQARLAAQETVPAPLPRSVDGAALRIEHAGLEADEDTDFHGCCLSR